VNRTDFQVLAEKRLTDSRVLFENGCFDGSYYLAGYVVECALKACIAKHTKEYDFPRERKFVESVYSHDLKGLLIPAGLAALFDRLDTTDKPLAVKWNVVKDWTEQSRYAAHGEKRAKDMLDAVSDPQGVLECLKQYW
jgi:HEPN domain-containing protein